MLAHGSDSDENTPPTVAPVLARQIDFGERTIVLGSDPEEEYEGPLVAGGGEQDDLLTDDGEGAAGDLLTEDEASNSPSDSVPLVSLGRKFLSDSQFGAVASWVVESPGASRQEREKEDRLVEDLLRDTPEVARQNPSSFSSSRVSGGSSQQTSKAGLSEGTSKADFSSSQGTSRADLSSQGTSKAGGSWNKLENLDDTVDEFDKMCLTPKAKTSFSDAPKELRVSIQVTPQNRPVSPRARKISSKVQSNKNPKTGLGSTSNTREASSDEVESQQESLHLRLSPSQDDQTSLRPPPSSHSPLSMAGGDTMLMPNATLNLDGLGSGGSVTLNSTADSRKPQRPIDNSVAGVAVRSWTPNLTKLGRGRQEDLEASKVGRIWGNLDASNVPSLVSEGVEGQVKVGRSRKKSSSSSGEEALSNFLTKVVSSRKQVLASCLLLRYVMIDLLFLFSGEQLQFRSRLCGGRRAK